MINLKLENYLKNKCSSINVKSHNVLDNTINKIKEFYEIKPVIWDKYQENNIHFLKIILIELSLYNMQLANDETKKVLNLEKADIIFFGVSRTSKTPTSIYLANKGYKVANIPFVLNKEHNFYLI